jgi:hypothetical protein
MRPLVCRCYTQWLHNVCAACGTYVVNWMYFIISEQMVIILYVEAPSMDYLLDFFGARPQGEEKSYS